MTRDLRVRLEAAARRTRTALLAELNDAGHWTGELSSSALATATATIALHAMDSSMHAALVQRGLAWLAANANGDGGWGDTPRSQSNLSTTALAWAAFGAAQADRQFPATLQDATGYLTRATGDLNHLVPALETKYGQDRTFSVPITMTLALSGRLGPEGWRRVRPLPFELAALPRGLFGALRLPVVSYALPALIAIGQVIHHHAPRWNPLRSLSRRRTLGVLEGLQPENGGFLEATPLTSFVTMSLAAMDAAGHSVAQRGAAFLRNSARPDGSWPIDTNLATWLTTLSVGALGPQADALTPDQHTRLRDWLLAQQYRVVHPYTGAAPGGWAWTPLPGGVPDADDTAGALLALRTLRDTGSPPPANLPEQAVRDGIGWLLDLQNRDGGMPSFCRGWGALPFDRSTPEITAHALRSWNAWAIELEPRMRRRLSVATASAIRFLSASQCDDGAWIPLWFGNEHTTAQTNPVYGTAQVLPALSAASEFADTVTMRTRAVKFLVSQQDPDGGWGGALGAPSTVEETALALRALASETPPPGTLSRGIEWLVNAVESDRLKVAAPIGLYFAKLWYFEPLYPLIFATDALSALSSQRD